MKTTRRGWMAALAALFAAPRSVSAVGSPKAAAIEPEKAEWFLDTTCDFVYLAPSTITEAHRAAAEALIQQAPAWAKLP